MVPPIQRISTMSNSRIADLPGVVTITNTQRVNLWNEKILKRFRRLVNNSEEGVLNHLIKDYYRLVKEQVTYLKERHLLRDKIADHLYSLHTSYVRLQEQQLIKTSFYLDTMEELLCLVCDLELEIVSLMRYRPAAIVTQSMINMLNIYLYNELTRTLHVLLRLNERYLGKTAYKLVMNWVYKYFLITVPVLNTSDLNYCLHYLLYQKWKKTKHESSHSAMDKYMNLALNRTSVSISQSRLLRKILKPSYNEITGVVDTFVNGVEGKIVQYFKYFEQSRELDAPQFQNTNSGKRRKKDIYEIEFVKSTVYRKTSNLRNNNGHANNAFSIAAKQDDVILLIEDDEEADSDVEIVASMVQTEATSNETQQNRDLLSTAAYLDNNIMSTDTSKLIPLFNSIAVAGMKDISTEKESSSFTDWVFTNKDNSEKNLEIIKFLKSVLDDFYSKAKSDEQDEFAMDVGVETPVKPAPESSVKHAPEKSVKPAPEKSIKPSPKVVANKEQMTETAAMFEDIRISMDTSTATDECSETLTQDITRKELNYEELPLTVETNVEVHPLKDAHRTHVTSSEVQTSSNLVVCSKCACHHSSTNIEISNTHDEIGAECYSKPAYKNAEIQTESGVIVTDVCNYRTVIETPPSDLEPALSPHNNFPFMNAINKFVEEEGLQIIPDVYNNASDPMKFGEITTQPYPGQLDFMQGMDAEELIKTQDETFDGFPYGNPQRDRSLSIDNEYVGEMHNESEAESHLVLLNNDQLEIDGLKMPLLEQELVDTYGPTSQVDLNQDIINSLESTDCNKNNSEVVGRELSPSPAYEEIPAQEFRKHLKEEKKKKRTSILKNSNKNTHDDDDLYNQPSTSAQHSTDISRSPISTRAASKRKQNTQEEEVLPKLKKVNFSEPDTVMTTTKDHPRRISYSIAEQAKDSMCINNIHRQDNKLIFLEPCIPIDIMPFSKFLEDHKMRQVNTYNKNINNIFFNKTLSLKEEPTRATIQRIDYKKFQKSEDSSFSSTPVKYSTITFHTSDESGFPRLQRYTDYDKTKALKEMAANIKCENQVYQEIYKRQPQVLLTLCSPDVLLQAAKSKVVHLKGSI